MNETIHIVPVATRDRIAVLDVTRGLAMLGIFFMNIPAMGQFIAAAPQRLGWGGADRLAFTTQFLLLEGTQRGLLELLFGAGLMIMARKVVAREGPVEVADVWYRRNLWLIVLGLVHTFVFLWFGEILTAYGAAALLVFQLRRAPPRWLFAGGTLALVVVGGLAAAGEAADRRQLIAQAPAALAREAAGGPIDDETRSLASDWRALLAERSGGGAADARDTTGHAGGIAAYWAWAAGMWIEWAAELPLSILEAACTMVIGMALFGWGITQGGRSRRFYLAMLLAGYGGGVALRLAMLQPVLAMAIVPDWTWYVDQPARLLLTFGHLAAINLAVAGHRGAALLKPLEACGQLPLSLYFGQSLIGMWLLFAPFGLGLWGRFGWAELMLTALAVQLAQILAANWWLRHFANGPFEWAWKSLSYLERQPFRRVAPAYR